MTLTSWIGTLDRKSFAPLPALCCVPGLLLILLLGEVLGQKNASLVAFGGAISVAFGAFQSVTRWRVAPMVLAATGMTVSAWCGTLAGGQESWLLLCCAVWAVACAWTWFVEVGAWWVMVQCSIALMVASSYPGDVVQAHARAGLVFAGCTFELLTVAFLWWRLPIVWPPGTGVQGPGIRKAISRTLGQWVPISVYSYRCALVAVVSLWLAQRLELPHSYWAPMTSLLVIRPSWQEAFQRGLLRAGGTVLGAGLATLAAALLRPGDLTLICAILFFLWLSLAVQKVHYGVLTVFITAFVSFMLAFDGLPEVEAAWYRILATVLGVGVALGVGSLARLGILPGNAVARADTT